MNRSDSVDFPELGSSVAEQLLRVRFGWYSRQATRSRLGHVGLGIVQLIAALVITLALAIQAPSWLSPALGALIAFVEGVRTLFRVQDAYVSYRQAAEELRNEAWLFAGKVGRYASTEDRDVVLAERIIEISARENATWVSTLGAGDRHRASDPNPQVG